MVIQLTQTPGADTSGWGAPGLGGLDSSVVLKRLTLGWGSSASSLHALRCPLFSTTTSTVWWHHQHNHELCSQSPHAGSNRSQTGILQLHTWMPRFTEGCGLLNLSTSLDKSQMILFIRQMRQTSLRRRKWEVQNLRVIKWTLEHKPRLDLCPPWTNSFAFRFLH